MGIFNSYIKGFSDNMLGPQAPSSDKQDSGAMNRFMQAMGAGQANKLGGSRSQYQAPDMPMAQAFQQMQSGMNNQNAGGELDAMFADEESGATESSYQEPTPKERRDQQIQAMITSGNSLLRDKGLEMYSKGTEKGPNSWQEYNLGVGNKGYAEYLKNNKGGINIHTGNQGPANVRYLTREEKVEGGLDPDVPYVLDNQGNPKPVAKGAQEDAIDASNTMSLVTSNMESMLFGKDGIYGDSEGFGEETGIPGAIKRTFKGNYERWVKDDSRFSEFEDLAGGMISNIARGLGGEKGPLSDSDMLRVKGLVPSTAGINVDTKATARKKMNMLRQLQEVKNRKGVVKPEDLYRIMGDYDPNKGSGTSDDDDLLPEGFTWD